MPPVLARHRLPPLPVAPGIRLPGAGVKKRKQNTRAKKESNLGVHILEEPNRKIRRILELAEDGRKRCTALPPLESELTFSRAPRKNIALVHGITEDGVKCKKISFEIDKKIVHHLRRKLTKRIERRLVDMFEGEQDDTDEDDVHADSKRRNSKRQSADQKNGLFTSYSEVGEKLGRPTHQLHRPGNGHGPSRKGDLDPLPNGHVTSDPSESSGKTSRQDQPSGKSRKLSSTTPLPDIGKGVDEERVVTLSGKGKRVSLQDPQPEHQNGHNGRPETPEDGARGEEVGENGDSDVSFRRILTSPIQTPVVYRPETSDTVRLSVEERQNQILQGHVHRQCPPDNKIIQLYICSGFADSEVERTLLMEQVWPSLREFCKNHGHELQVLDLHWGFKDGTSDDHQIPRVFSKYIDICKDNPIGVNFLVLLGEKYGQCLLPAEVPAGEFDEIVAAAMDYRNKQLVAIRAKMAEVETKRAEREQQRQNESETASNDTTSVSREGLSHGSVLDRRSESFMSIGKDGELIDEDEDLKFARRTSIIRAEGLVIKGLREEEEDLPDVNSLQQWYELDENASPPVYRLRKISSVYKDITKNDGARRQAARSSWLSTSSKLMRVLQDFSEGVVSPDSREKYFTSLLDNELEQVLNDFDIAASQTVYFKRTLLALQNHLSDIKVGDYIDVNPKNADAIDTRARKKMQYLREEFVPGKGR